jgi:gamma-glutamylcyclotransferase (GGCT)/AIG2-like uncharacterized protein YtfP
MQEMTFFFYGTLMGSEIGEDLERTPAKIQGQLWDFGPFPAAIEGEGVIKGMLTRANVPGEFLHVMDRYEGYYGEGNPYNYYVRKRVVAIDSAGNEVECWVYFFADTKTFESEKANGTIALIENGDWFGIFENTEFKGDFDAEED